TCHPLLPFVDWAGLSPALDRLGSGVGGGLRARGAPGPPGFVPARGLPTALEMAHGRAGGKARVGYLLSPPYFPLRVSPYSSPTEAPLAMPSRGLPGLPRPHLCQP